MDLIGKWKVAKTLYMDPDTFEESWRTPEELEELGADADEITNTRSCTFVFTQDGKVLTAMTLPEGTPQEEIDAAVASGEVELYGDLVVFEKRAWKEENGRYYYDTGIEAEVLGETAAPWVEITEEDGYLQLCTFLLEKAES